ncbi:MAG: hypothetical protein HW392_635 [Steroidobacteraceae bacterium]|nr:hypothetical protein [Steroidobacteraceae bacterium]
MIGTQLIEHRVRPAGGIRIAQVAGRRELLQNHLEARLALEFSERGIEFSGCARRLEMYQRLARVSASHREDRKTGLRFGKTRRSCGHVAEVHCRQGFESEFEAQVAECGVESRPIFDRHELHGCRVLQARHCDACRIRIDGGQRPDPGITCPRVGAAYFSCVPGRVQCAAIITLRIERVGPIAPAGSIARAFGRRGERERREHRDRQNHAAVPLCSRSSGASPRRRRLGRGANADRAP